MQKIKIIKTTEEIPIDKAVNFCLQALRRPYKLSIKEWSRQIKNDLIFGRKFLRVKEITLSERRLDKNFPIL